MATWPRAIMGATVGRLAKFLGVSLNPLEHGKVTERCDIKHMKTVAHKFDYLQWAGDGSKVMCGKDGCPGFDGSLIRSGQSGEGKGFFTEEMRALWDAAVESEFGSDPAMRKWAEGGGGFD